MSRSLRWWDASSPLYPTTASLLHLCICHSMFDRVASNRFSQYIFYLTGGCKIWL